MKVVAFRAKAITLVLTIVILAITWMARPAYSDSDTLGQTGPYHLPVSSRSFNTTPRTFALKGQNYTIPRNYIVAIENKKAGTVGAISMQALLPNLVGLTKENAHCFLNRHDPCNADVIVIGLTDYDLPHDGAWRLEQTRAISQPGKKKGPCGLEYYEGLGSVQQGSVVFDEFFTKFPGDRDLSLLRCPEKGSPWQPVCNSTDNVGNGTGFYYIFSRSKLCKWDAIKHDVLALIASFQKGRNHDE